MMAERDLYAVLGVARGASVDEIRKAFRARARTLHPDVNKAPDAAKQFAQVQHAYEILTDQTKRSLYDQYGEAGLSMGSGGSGPWGPGESGGTGASGGSGARRGQPIDMDAESLSEVFDAIFGGMRGGETGSGPGARRGRGSGGFGGNSGSGRSRAGSGTGFGEQEDQAHVHEVRVDFVTAAKGGSQRMRVSLEGGIAKDVEVRIPAGVEHGAQLRMRGVLQDPRGNSGDLLLKVYVLPHDLWRRGEHVETGMGLDVFLDLPLTISEATLGATVDVPTLAGVVQLTVPSGTASGRKLRLRGMGIRTDDGRKGDFVAVTQIVPPGPSALVASDLEKDVLRRIGSMGVPPRAGQAWRKA